MPMRKDDEEDGQATTPDRAYQYIYDEAGLDQSEADAFVNAKVSEAEEALTKAQSVPMPQMGTSIQKYNQAKAKRQEKIDEAQQALDYWNGIASIQAERKAQEEKVQQEAEKAKAEEAEKQEAVDNQGTPLNAGSSINASDSAMTEKPQGNTENSSVRETTDSSSKQENKAESNEKEDKSNKKQKLSQQKANGTEPLTHNERVLRDVLVEGLNEKNGIPAGMNVEQAQSVLDWANGKEQSKGLRLALNALNEETDDSRQPMAEPSRQRGELSDSDAKVDNRIELSKDYQEKLEVLIKRIENGEKISPQEFLLAIEEALGSHNENVDKSQYFKGEADATLRLANHRGNARMFLIHDHVTGNTSVVVKMSEKKGKKNNNVELNEYVYFPDKMNAEVQRNIVEGLKEWGETGEYNQSCDLLTKSTIRNGVREQRVFHGSGMDSDHVRFFRTKDGEAYGFTIGGKIYIDPRIATSETPIHEYAHLWATALRQGNAEEWQNVVGLMKGTSVWDEVKQAYPELQTDDEIADEVLAHYSGRRGAERLREEAKKITEGKGSVLEKADAVNALERVKQALDKFWKGVCDFLHIHFTSAEEVADRVMKDLLEGVDPREFGKTEDNLRMSEDAEMKEIVAKAKADGTYMKAPNGKSSKLSPKQWAQVRTKAFKNWFGDWEKFYKKNFLLRNEAVSRLIGKEFEKVEDKTLQEQVVEFYNTFGNKALSPIYGEIVLDEKGIDDSFAHGIGRNKAIAYAAVKDVIEKGIVVDFHKNHKGRGYNTAIIAAPIQIGKERYICQVAIRQNKSGNRFYLHEVTAQKNLPSDASITNLAQKPTPKGDFAKVLKNILSASDDVSKVVDENGEPMVVYHGTPHAGFSVFNTLGRFRGSHSTSRNTGVYATNDRSLAYIYTSKKDYDNKNDYTFSDWDGVRQVYSLYLNMKNPLVIECAGADFDEIRIGGRGRKTSTDAVVRKLRKGGFGKGYDGAVFKDVYDGDYTTDYVALSPNQIKSATDNVGTFDVGNNDIRYQFVGEKGADTAKASEENVDEGLRFRTSEELNNEYGDRWLTEQTNEDGRHTTQVKNTINSYKKFGDWVKTDSKGREVSVLDASSGLGLGTEWMRENGMEVDDVEPYPSKDRIKPTFTSYDDIDKKYNYIISNAVLNVIPSDWRANVLHDMADKLKVGGKMVINVRSAESIRSQGKEGKTRITLDDPSEILVLRPNGSIKAYQKGFTKQELKEWCENELGNGYSVEIATNKNAGGSYDTAVVVTKNNESNTIGAASEAGHPRRVAQPVPNSNANLGNNSNIAKNLDEISESISKSGEMGAHEFLYYLSKAFGFNGEDLSKSYYKNLGTNVGIRIADHYANTDNFKEKSENGKNYGLVVKLSRNRFKEKDDVNYLEYVYFPDKLSEERQQDITQGMKEFLETGDFSKLPHPDKIHVSGEFKEELYRNGSIDDMSDSENITDTLHAQQMTDYAHDVAEVLNVGDDVDVVSSEGLSGKKKDAKGWYDPKTGKITIVADNHSDMADMEKTVLHEAVAHKGLRALLGDKFDAFLDHVYTNADAGVRERVTELMSKNGWDVRKVTEEYLASLAEDTDFENMDKSTWQNSPACA